MLCRAAGLLPVLRVPRTLPWQPQASGPVHRALPSGPRAEQGPARGRGGPQQVGRQEGGLGPLEAESGSGWRQMGRPCCRLSPEPPLWPVQGEGQGALAEHLQPGGREVRPAGEVQAAEIRSERPACPSATPLPGRAPLLPPRISHTHRLASGSGPCPALGSCCWRGLSKDMFLGVPPRGLPPGSRALAPRGRKPRCPPPVCPLRPVGGQHSLVGSQGYRSQAGKWPSAQAPGSRAPTPRDAERQGARCQGLWSRTARLRLPALPLASCGQVTERPPLPFPQPVTRTTRGPLPGGVQR